MSGIKLKGDTTGEILLDVPAVAGTNTLTLPAETGTLATTTEINTEVNNVYNSLGTRNLIINGDMRIAQRATSKTGVTARGYYTVDRFEANLVGAGTWTQTQDTDVPTGEGFSKSLKMLCTTANATLGSNQYLTLKTMLEGSNVQHLKYNTTSAEKLTYSFWIKSNKTGTYISELYNVGKAKQVSKAFTIDTADTWEKKTLTFDGDTLTGFNDDTNRGLQVNVWLATGNNYTTGTLNTSWQDNVQVNRAVGQVNLADAVDNYFNITGMQLEVGEKATPFEHVPVDISLNRCRRYFLKKFLSHKLIVVYVNGDTRGHQEHIGIMRDIPTVSGERLTNLGSSETSTWGVFTQHSLNFSHAGTLINGPVDSWRLSALAYENQYGDVDSTTGKDICVRYGHEGGSIEGYSGSLNLVAINTVGTVNFDAEL